MKKPLPSRFGVYNFAGDGEPLDWLTRAFEAERTAVDAFLKAQHKDLLSQLSARFRSHAAPPDLGPEVEEMTQTVPSAPNSRQSSKEKVEKLDKLRAMARHGCKSTTTPDDVNGVALYKKSRLPRGPSAEMDFAIAGSLQSRTSASSKVSVGRDDKARGFHNSLRHGSAPNLIRSFSRLGEDALNGVDAHRNSDDQVSTTTDDGTPDAAEPPQETFDEPGQGVGDVTAPTSVFDDCVRTPSGTPSGTSSKNRVSLRSQPAITFRRSNSFFGRIEELVNHNYFEAGFGFLIVLNTIVIAVEAHYDGLETGYAVQFRDYRTPAATAWPNARIVFDSFETMFGICFTVEVALKVVGLGSKFLWNFWNWMDSFIVTVWLLTTVGSISFGTNTMFLRMARLVRLLRMLRLTRTFQVFDVLHLLVGSLRASMSVLLWSLVLLFMIMVMVALFLMFFLEDYITGDVGTKQEEVFALFGTFTRAFLTMYEITLGNWIPVFRMLHENVSEWFGLFFLVYRSLVGFAVLNVINAVFLHETFKVASQDEEIMILQKERQVRTHMRNMQLFFQEADENEDGAIGYDEFVDIVSDPRVKMWLSAMELELEDVELVFGLMGCTDGSQKLSLSELAHGFANLKGAAKSIDMITMMHQCRRMENLVMEVLQHVSDSSFVHNDV